MMPRLSIITVNFDNAAGLAKTMQSVREQGYTDYEYIVIDGGSTDGSKVIIEQSASWLTHWVSEKDKGIYDAMNKGIALAKGDYIIFLNSGDYFLQEKVLFTFSQHASANYADIFYGNILLGENNNLVHQKYPRELTLDFWQNDTINHQAAFIKTTLFNEMGLYDQVYTLAADYAFFLKSFIRGKIFKQVDSELVYFSLDGASLRNKIRYGEEMREAWQNIVPPYLAALINENNNFRQLMKHRLMIWATRAQRQYSRIKNLIR